MRAFALFVLLALVPSLPSQETRTDAFGDSLPKGALSRLGSRRMNPSGWGSDLALTPDGKELVLSAEKEVQFWDTESGKLLRSWPNDEADDYLAVSPDGRRLARAKIGQKPIVCDLASGKRLFECQGDAGAIAYSPNSKWLATIPWICEPMLFDASTGECRHRFRRMYKPSCIAFSDDSRWIAVGGILDSNHWPAVEVWEIDTGKRIASIRLDNDGEIESVVLLPDHKSVLIGTRAPSPGKLQVFDLATGKRLRTLREATVGPLLSSTQQTIGFSANGEVWDLHRCEAIRRVFHQECDKVALSSDGSRSATWPPLRIWNTKNGKPTFAPPGQGFAFDHLAFSADSKQLITLSEHEGIVRKWDVRSGSHLGTIADKNTAPRKRRAGPVALTTDGKGLIVGGELWDAKRDLPSGKLEDHRKKGLASSPWYRLLIAPDGSTAVDWSAEDNLLQFWNVGDGSLRRSMSPPCEGDVLSVSCAFSNDGKRFAVACDVDASKAPTPTLFLFDTPTGTMKSALRPSQCGIIHPRFSPDGNWLLLGVPEQRMELWNLETSCLCRSITGVTVSREQSACSFAPHSQMFATGKPDHGIILVETTTGQTILELPGHSSRITTTAFSPDGRMVASGSEDRTALIWSLLDHAVSCETWTDDRIWDGLGTDAARAYPIVWALAKQPERARSMIRKARRNRASHESKSPQELIVDLGSPTFAVRSRAMETLREIGAPALAAVQGALRETTDAETRRRLQALVSTLPTQSLTRDALRCERLEQLNWLCNSASSK